MNANPNNLIKQLSAMQRAIYIVLCALSVGNCANILGITTVPSRSHHIWNEVLAVALAERGHNVTLLTPDPKGKGNDNYRVIQIEGVYDKIQEEKVVESFSDEPLTVDVFLKLIAGFCKDDIKSEAVKHLMNYPKDYKFDLILWDMISGECLFPLFKRFGSPPVIGLSPFGMAPYIHAMMGSHSYNYVPFIYSSPTDRVTFWERVQNTFYINYYNYKRQRYLEDMQETAKEVFGSDIEDFATVERNIAVALVNADPNYDYPQALPPNVIPVGGMQVTPAKALPKDLQKLLDEAKNGVIYFSLGSNVRPELLPRDFADKFNTCFGKLPYTILWKFDGNRAFSKNIQTRKWLPQPDVLAHPNVKLFITHGGALSTQEAMHYGVPLVGLPFFFDQHNNVDKLVSKGLAKKLDLKTLTSDNICATIQEVLNNKMYRDNMKTLSAHVRDQQNTPLERAVFWVEYVLRHGTGEHLSLAARDMSLIETHNFDIMLLVLGICAMPFMALLWCCRCCSSEKKCKSKLKQK